jgi:hypothetical protein
MTMTHQFSSVAAATTEASGSQTKNSPLHLEVKNIYCGQTKQVSSYIKTNVINMSIINQQFKTRREENEENWITLICSGLLNGDMLTGLPSQLTEENRLRFSFFNLLWYLYF